MASPKSIADKQRVAPEKPAQSIIGPFGNLSENAAIVTALLITCIALATIGFVINEIFVLMGS